MEFRGKIECTRDTSVAGSIVVQLHLILRCFFLLFSLFLFQIYQQKMGKKSLRQSTAAAAATATALALARHDTSITAKKCVFKWNAKQVQLLQILDENK